MANRPQYFKGGDLMCFIGEKTKAKAIGFASSHTFSINASTSDTSNKDVGGGLYSTADVTLLSFTITCEAFFGVTLGGHKSFKDLVEIMTNRKPVRVVFGFEGTNGTSAADIHKKKTNDVPTTGWTEPTEAVSDYYEADMIITSIDLNASNSEIATYTVTFENYGSMKINGKEVTDQEDGAGASLASLAPVKVATNNTKETTKA